MKFIKYVLVASMFLATSANAGLLSDLMTSDFPEMGTTNKYKIEVYGFNIRVYEWQPKDNANVRCVFVAGSENSTGVACYDVEESIDE